jgi:predicted house-cleaning noncanonical NTP pyrophosphatase (MazG superfamily)
MTTDPLPGGQTAANHYANGYPIKLVRDHIGERLGGDGTLTYELADEQAHVALLRRKLIEEAIEYLTDPSVGELADVLEAVWSLAAVDLRAPFEVIEQRAKSKRIERGAFKRGVVMVAHHEADGRELLPREDDDA